ncbi:MAG: C39 family peptidase [Defluviitaleaceae bacterium]|nr:C39 family peptidase [Defluviitaleaceae bacterium]
MKKFLIPIVISAAIVIPSAAALVMFVFPRGEAAAGEAVYAVNQVPLARMEEAREIYAELLANPPAPLDRGEFQVFIAGMLLGEFDTMEQAQAASAGFENVFIRRTGHNGAAWDNYPPFFVFREGGRSEEFMNFGEAVAYARQDPASYIYHRRDQARLWAREAELNMPAAHMIYGVPMIYQLPALPRGCEVTSLAMLLNFRGVDVDKMQLAEEVRRDPTPGGIANGRVYMGDPNYGFIGNMHDITEFGYGVYAPPIFDLLRSYFPNEAVDLTGAEFDDLLQFVVRGIPVWIVTNTRFHYLPQYQFFMAQTPQGQHRATWRMHAVVITGFDNNTVFFNDPLGNAARANRASFQAAWEQMGSQAVTLSR